MVNFVRIVIVIFALIVAVCTVISIVFELMSRYEKDIEKKQKKHKRAISFGIIPILAYTVIAILWAVNSSMH